MSTLLALWCSVAVAGVPDYDAFSEADGFIAEHQELAAWRMMRDQDQLEAVYADAAKGNARARNVARQLEATLSAGGRELAKRASSPECLVPVAHELKESCRPDWSFFDFLSQERPGGVRLRTVIFTAFAETARQRGLENQVILSVVNGLLSVALAGSVLRQATVATPAPPVPRLRGAPTAPESLQSSRAATLTAAAADAVAAAETTRLYRAVSEAELKQILETGKLHPGPNSLGGKWFAESAEDAVKWGTRLSGPGKFRIIEVELPRPVADKLLRRPRLDSIGPARYGELDQLEGAVIREVK